MTKYQESIALTLFDETERLTADQLAERIAVEMTILCLKIGHKQARASGK